jgi:Protein of unknown function (DUF3224)
VRKAVATFTNASYDEEPIESADGAELGRIHITRRFHGDIEGTSRAELLTARTPDGTAVYLALDHISGRVDGREGSFVLQHGGSVTSEGPTTWGQVVAASGTGELRGLSGRSEIAVDADVNHRLALDYELSE